MFTELTFAVRQDVLVLIYNITCVIRIVIHCLVVGAEVYYYYDENIFILYFVILMCNSNVLCIYVSPCAVSFYSDC